MTEVDGALVVERMRVSELAAASAKRRSSRLGRKFRPPVDLTLAMGLERPPRGITEIAKDEACAYSKLRVPVSLTAESTMGPGAVMEWIVGVESRPVTSEAELAPGVYRRAAAAPGESRMLAPVGRVRFRLVGDPEGSGMRSKAPVVSCSTATLAVEEAVAPM